METHEIEELRKRLDLSKDIYSNKDVKLIVETTCAGAAAYFAIKFAQLIKEIKAAIFLFIFRR